MKNIWQRQREKVRRGYATDQMVQRFRYDGRKYGWLQVEERRILKPYYKTHLLTKMKLLDVGCGTGREGLALIRDGFKVIGLDSSAPMIKTAQQISRQEQISFPLVVGDLNWLPFKPATFDLVFMTTTLIQYIPGRINRLGALKEAYRVLAPEGTVLMNFHTPGFDFRPFEAYLGPRWLRRIILGMVYLLFLLINSITNIQRKLGRIILGKAYRGLEPWDQVAPAGELSFFHWYQVDEAEQDLQTAGLVGVTRVPGGSGVKPWPPLKQSFWASGTKPRSPI
jgi:ubiquinone/menaquinone biosynthesis C-methylase UbiE